MWICPIQHVDLFMFKLGRENMLTQQAMGWNRKKTENLHKALAQRYVTVSSLIKIWWTLFFAGRWHEIVLPFFCVFKISERAKLEAASLSDFQQKQNLTQQTIEQWVFDVQQWAVTGKSSTLQQLFKHKVDINWKMKWSLTVLPI